MVRQRAGHGEHRGESRGGVRDAGGVILTLRHALAIPVGVRLPRSGNCDGLIGAEHSVEMGAQHDWARGRVPMPRDHVANLVPPDHQIQGGQLALDVIRPRPLLAGGRGDLADRDLLLEDRVGLFVEAGRH